MLFNIRKFNFVLAITTKYFDISFKLYCTEIVARSGVQALLFFRPHLSMFTLFLFQHYMIPSFLPTFLQLQNNTSFAPSGVPQISTILNEINLLNHRPFREKNGLKYLWILTRNFCYFNINKAFDKTKITKKKPIIIRWIRTGSYPY